jgi:hypothetical protein
MKIKILLWINMIFIFILLNGTSLASEYYIDANIGKNTNDGLSPQTAWGSLEKISQFQFGQGDKVLLKGGQSFYGTMKVSSIAGTPNSRFIISSYGAGRAVIISGDSSGIITYDCEYLTIKNLICKGSGRLQGNGGNGIDCINNKNLSVDSVDASGYLFSGIRILNGSNIRITNAHAHENGFCGIYVTSDKSGEEDSEEIRIQDIYIGYSITYNNPGCPVIKDNHSGNGILVGGASGALIEYCEAMNNGWDMPREGNGPVGIWAYMSNDVTIQYCYSHHNKTSEKGHDGGGFDFDGGITNSIMQYNLSAFNEGAGYGMFQYADAATWDNNIIRYNISYNDGEKNGRCGIFMWCDPVALPMTNLHAYNNTIVNGFGYGVNFLPGHYENFIFENNIFLVTDHTDEFTGGNFSGALFNNNLYWNSNHHTRGISQPKTRFETAPILANPMLVLPQSGQLKNLEAKTINAIPYFKPLAGSPAIGSGKAIINPTSKDFWGNSIPTRETVNVGAFGK